MPVSYFSAAVIRSVTKAASTRVYFGSFFQKVKSSSWRELCRNRQSRACILKWYTSSSKAFPPIGTSSPSPPKQHHQLKTKCHSHPDHHPFQPHFALCQTFTEESGYIPGKFSSVTYTYSLLAEIPISASLVPARKGHFEGWKWEISIADMV